MQLFDVWPLWIVFHAAPMPGGIMRADKKGVHVWRVLAVIASRRDARRQALHVR
jgi:hypothetical protein